MTPRVANAALPEVSPVPETDPYHDRAVRVTPCGRICFGRLEVAGRLGGGSAASCP